MSKANSKTKKLLKKKVTIISTSILLFLIAAIFSWGWFHSFSADKATHKAYNDFSKNFSNTTDPKYDWVKEINDDCIFKIYFDNEHNKYIFKLRKNKPENIYMWQKSVFDEMFKITKIENDLYKKYSKYFRNMWVEDMYLKFHKLEINNNTNHDGINLEKGFIDNLFCSIRNSECCKIKKFNNFFNKALEDLKANSNNLLAVVVDNFEITILSIIHTNQNIASVKTFKLDFGTILYATQAYNILKYAVYTLVEAEN
ncbi:hypothetical protein EDEG_02999 [Edhazardia aedis USNM 41457]|uniref:Uncharacterized protein n=1 Tax=Edhazardia aedis (strain USNM 41457) TaxID=1003232 RepID=J9DMP4_EDHAE|nr:hypothetical protein EDEG_02999 [Edhazardia aedis USNM 41457]|eukprot:EJW02602.1 hypothetical protein EDEG_02999 [Edhazardia aedis USNM 41457]